MNDNVNVRIHMVPKYAWLNLLMFFIFLFFLFWNKIVGTSIAIVWFLWMPPATYNKKQRIEKTYTWEKIKDLTIRE